MLSGLVAEVKHLELFIRFVQNAVRIFQCLSIAKKSKLLKLRMDCQTTFGAILLRFSVFHGAYFSPMLSIGQDCHLRLSNSFLVQKIFHRALNYQSLWNISNLWLVFCTFINRRSFTRLQLFVYFQGAHI